MANDDITELYYLRARRFDTTAGRFTQEDTYLGDGRNLYVYVGNNPLKYVDPSGYAAVDSLDSGADMDPMDDQKSITPSGGGDYNSRGANSGIQSGTTSGVTNGKCSGSKGFSTGGSTSRGTWTNSNVSLSALKGKTKVSPPATLSSQGRTALGRIVKGFGAENTQSSEVFYRTMSQADYDILRMTGELPASKETFISPTYEFSSQYNGITVKFKLKNGTTSSLLQVGVGNNSFQAIKDYGLLQQVTSGWSESYAFFKGEGFQTNIGLGYGKALEIFNSNLISFENAGGK